MKRRRVTFREDAVHDLEELFGFIAERSGSRAVALRYIRRIRQLCMKLDLMPERGRRRDDLEQGVRLLVFEGRAFIAYRVEDDRVRILNIFHAGRDYESLVGGASPTPGDDS